MAKKKDDAAEAVAAPDVAIPSLELPPSLKKLNTGGGIHRRGRKILTYGPTGGGKSFFAAHAPRPLIAFDFGEGGIQPHLRKGDICLEITNPEDYDEALRWVFSQEDKLASLIEDPVTASWEDWMDYWSDKLGGEIGGADWRHVKGPWKRLHRQKMRSRLNIIGSAWLRDIQYAQENPGSKRIDIRPQDVPAVEKSVPYGVDFIFKCDVVKTRENVPTNIHTVTVVKARRPHSIPPDQLFIGKQWKFDAKEPVDPWQVCVAPFDEKWEDGAVDYLGFDPNEVKREVSMLEQDAMDATTGRLLRIISEQRDLNTYKNKVFPEQVLPETRNLDFTHRRTVEEAHQKKKGELEAATSGR